MLHFTTHAHTAVNFQGISTLCAGLVDLSLLNRSDALTAESIAKDRNIRLTDVLTRRYGIGQYPIACLLAQIHGAEIIDPVDMPADPALITPITPQFCIKNSLLPWRKVNGTTIVITARPDEFQQHIAQLRLIYGKIRMAVATPDQINHAIADISGPMLAIAAENRVKTHESCRDINPRSFIAIGLWACIAIFLCSTIVPGGALVVLTLWTLLTLMLGTILKAAAAIAIWRQPQQTTVPKLTDNSLPIITMLVPLYKEKAIAQHLLTRLNALNYPSELLDICLVLEEHDMTTRNLLAQTKLAPWMRAIVVPDGILKTKPRAMNYALDFAHGSIIGIWDAEDAPDPDQLQVVAAEFAHQPGDVACLQGKLDYYNASTNWLTRCFAVEYASWFRVILPGLARMGLVIPLGGTTLFFKRKILEKLGGWDAHNVTEDADLGIRLARHGYRTALIDTVTEEEANGLFWPWIRQRSRWLKGYAITYGVHMRNPIQLWRDFGAWRFAGFQLLFLGTLTQFVLAPMLWTLWILPFGLWHPLEALLAPWMFLTVAAMCALSGITGFFIAAIGLKRAQKTKLLKWAFLLPLYFPLGTIASYKGLIELLTRPFYWDKTAHGILLPTHPIAPPQPPAHPASDG